MSPSLRYTINFEPLREVAVDGFTKGVLRAKKKTTDLVALIIPIEWLLYLPIKDTPDAAAAKWHLREPGRDTEEDMG